MAKDPARIPDLPCDILIDILSRLPVKALLKFRCVSRSWRSLIFDPHFIKHHIHKSTSDENYTNHRVIVSSCRQDLGLGYRSLSLCSTLNEPYLDALEIDNPIKTQHQHRCYFRCKDHDHVIVGSCNGLLCMASATGEVVSLWNPSTRQFRRLPDSGFKWANLGHITFGFGYDCSRDDYKVVAVHNCFTSNLNENEAKVYSLSTNSWRVIGNFPYATRHMDPGLFVGGALNWHALSLSSSTQTITNFNRDLYSSWDAVGLDLATERYWVVPQPVYEDRKSCRTLGLLGRHLCVLVTYCGDCVELWVMKEYRVGDSWTRLITMPEYCSPYTLLLYSDNGVLLVAFKAALVLYDLNNSSSPRYTLFGNF